MYQLCIEELKEFRDNLNSTAKQQKIPLSDRSALKFSMTQLSKVDNSVMDKSEQIHSFVSSEIVIPINKTASQKQRILTY